MLSFSELEFAVGFCFLGFVFFFAARNEQSAENLLHHGPHSLHEYTFVKGLCKLRKELAGMRSGKS